MNANGWFYTAAMLDIDARRRRRSKRIRHSWRQNRSADEIAAKAASTITGVAAMLLLTLAVIVTTTRGWW